MKRSMILAALACGLSWIAMGAGCAPSHVLGDAEIPSATKLGDVMWSQANAADPAFKKIGAANYTDADYAQFIAVGKRLQITSAKTKESFSKGDGFNALADQLGAKAGELITASEAKDPKAASVALASTKDTCKSCHRQFR